MNTQVIILGFHRSGTSLFTDYLNQAGLFVGSDLLGATPTNHRGHFEDRGIVSFHTSMLQRAGVNWLASAPYFPVYLPQDHKEGPSPAGEPRRPERDLGLQGSAHLPFLGPVGHPCVQPCLRGSVAPLRILRRQHATAGLPRRQHHRGGAPAQPAHRKQSGPERGILAAAHGPGPGMRIEVAGALLRRRHAPVEQGEPACPRW